MTLHQEEIKKVLPETSCSGKPAGEILGQTVEYLTVRETVEGDATHPSLISVKENWKAPALGCTPLREHFLLRDQNGRLMSDTWHTALTLTFMNVDEFFAIPQDYVERKPSEVLQELHRIDPEHYPLSDLTGADNAYKVAHDRLSGPATAQH